MSLSTVYLVTGANRSRGIGLSLTAEILSKHENAFVYAGVRDPGNATALDELKSKYPDRITIVKCVSADTSSNIAMAKEIEESHGRLDTVIANAALLNSASLVHETSALDMEEHFRVNVMGPTILFQSVYELLKKSANPRFIPITSLGGSIGGPFIEFPLGSVAYASTKATLNWISRKIHFENPWLITFPLSPGGVATDMLDYTMAADKTGFVREAVKQTYGEAPTASQAAALMLNIIDNSTREKEGGEFLNLDGTKSPW